MTCAKPCVPRPDRTSSGARPLWIACGVLVLSAIGVNLLLFPKYEQQQRQQQQQLSAAKLDGGEIRLDGTQATSSAFAGNDAHVSQLLSGLIDPHNGDNGTDPAQTITEECAGQFDLPVLLGVDVVAYWSLPEGAEPVLGTSNLMAMFGDYRFFFSSIENLRTFESDPLKYLPAWGGFCSYGVANEPVWTNTTLGPFGNPAKWEILGKNGEEARLHVFRSTVPMQKFEEDVQGNIERGDAVWRDWVGVDAAKKGLGPLNTACFCNDSVCDDK